MLLFYLNLSYNSLSYYNLFVQQLLSLPPFNALVSHFSGEVHLFRIEGVAIICAELRFGELCACTRAIAPCDLHARTLHPGAWSPRRTDYSSSFLISANTFAGNSPVPAGS